MPELLCGYPVIYNPHHHRHLSNGMVYEHIIVAEQKIGRELLSEEVVHHIDQDKTNNDPNNLLIFASTGDHTRFHNHNCSKYYLDENGIAHCDTNLFPAIGLDYSICFREEITYVNCYDEVETVKIPCLCELCGEPLHTISSRICPDCEKIYISSLSKKPQREELKNMIRNKSFESIGREFGVSGKAVAKWCKSYALPYKRSDINSIQDKDWKFI